METFDGAPSALAFHLDGSHRHGIMCCGATPQLVSTCVEVTMQGHTTTSPDKTVECIVLLNRTQRSDIGAHVCFKYKRCERDSERNSTSVTQCCIVRWQQLRCWLFCTESPGVSRK